MRIANSGRKPARAAMKPRPEPPPGFRWITRGAHYALEYECSKCGKTARTENRESSGVCLSCSKIQPIEWRREGSCMVVTSHKQKTRYIHIGRGGKKNMALHRIICERRHGPHPDLVAMHSCDNIRCINPDHLSFGTQKQNLQGMTDRGRRARGEQSGRSKLAEADVIEIRGSTESQEALASRFNVTQSAISNIKSRKRWRHIQ